MTQENKMPEKIWAYQDSMIGRGWYDFSPREQAFTEYIRADLVKPQVPQEVVDALVKAVIKYKSSLQAFADNGGISYKIAFDEAELKLDEALAILNKGVEK